MLLLGLSRLYGKTRSQCYVYIIMRPTLEHFWSYACRSKRWGCPLPATPRHREMQEGGAEAESRHCESDKMIMEFHSGSNVRIASSIHQVGYVIGIHLHTHN
jgi:hypothetical protein